MFILGYKAITYRHCAVFLDGTAKVAWEPTWPPACRHATQPYIIFCLQTYLHKLVHCFLQLDLADST